MKRTVSTILALLLTAACFLTPILAAEDTKTDAPTTPTYTEVVNVDFAQKYKDLNLTGATDANSIENLGITVANKTSQKYQKAKAVLTANGLLFSSVNFHAHGISLAESLADKTDYTIETTMKFDASGNNCYLFFGFANDLNGDDGWQIVNGGTNFRFESGDDNSKNKMLFNGGYGYDNEQNANALKIAIKDEKKVATYRFVVEDGKLAKIIVTCDGTTVTYANAEVSKRISAANGKFTMALRADSDQVLNVTLEKVTVTETGASSALIEKDYKAIYTAKGLTADTSAKELASDLGLEIIERLKKSYRDQNYQTLTADGLELGSYSDHVSAYVAQNDMTGYSEYVYEFTMAIDQGNKSNNYLVWGSGYEPNAHTDQWCFTKRNEGENYSVLVFKSDDLYCWADFAATNDDASKTKAKALNQAIASGETLTYRFFVKNGKMNSISVTYGETSVTYTNAAKGLTVDPKSMILSFRCDGGSVCSATLKSLRISGVRGDVTPDEDDPIYTPTNTLAQNRTQPAEPELAYTDAATTNYKPGYVLHHMDFSKITDFADTGYFVTNDAEPVGFEIKDGELLVKTNSSDGVKIMLTGNGIPKNIQNFTAQIKFRFVEPSSSYFVFIQSNEIGTDGKTSSQKDTCFRYNGTLDNCTTTVAEATVKAFWDAVHAGEEVTFTYTAMERETMKITASCGGVDMLWYKGSNTISVGDSFFGFMVGRGTYLAISTVTVIAGTVDEYADSGLVWPGEANALVQNVSANAIQTNEQKPADTEESNTGTTEKPTEAATAPTEKPTDTDKVSDTETDAATGDVAGCESSVSGGAVLAAVLVSALGIALPMKKNRKL